jgi:hypothetical protein
MRKLSQLVLIACLWVVGSFAQTQTPQSQAPPSQAPQSQAPQTQTVEVTVRPLTDNDIQLLRENIQAEKNDIITKTMAFSETESAKFWPIYRRYASEQQKIGSQRVALIKDYAKSYDNMDDAKARNMVQRMFQIDDANQKLREQYLPQFESALGPVRAMRFYQVDSRLTQMINLQIASEIPLAH